MVEQDFKDLADAGVKLLGEVGLGTVKDGKTAQQKSDELLSHLIGATVTIVLVIAIFVGWRIKKEHLDSQLVFPSPAIASTWLFLIRFVAPLAILFVMINTLI